MDTLDKMYIQNPYNLDLKMTNTHRHLIKALYTLVSSSPFETITVKEICKEANVSRSGFYNNFEDKYHLLLFYLDEIRGEVKTKLDFNEEQFIFVGLLEYIKSHAPFFKSLLLSDSGVELSKMLEGVIIDEIKQFLWTRLTLNPQETELSHDLQAVFLTGGVSNGIRWWVLNDFPLTIDEMNNSIGVLFFSA